MLTCDSGRSASAALASLVPEGSSVLVGWLIPPTNLTDELVRRLAAEIENGKLLSGAKLPTEHEIMASTGVSRTVVREAIAALRAWFRPHAAGLGRLCP